VKIKVARVINKIKRSNDMEQINKNTLLLWNFTEEEREYLFTKLHDDFTVFAEEEALWVPTHLILAVKGNESKLRLVLNEFKDVPIQKKYIYIDSIKNIKRIVPFCIKYGIVNFTRLDSIIEKLKQDINYE
jgi:hypothetical protein